MAGLFAERLEILDGSGVGRGDLEDFACGNVSQCFLASQDGEGAFQPTCVEFLVEFHHQSVLGTKV